VPTLAAAKHLQKDSAFIALFICAVMCAIGLLWGALGPFRRGFALSVQRRALQHSACKHGDKTHSGIEQITEHACVSPRAAPAAISVAGGWTTAPLVTSSAFAATPTQQHRAAPGSNNSDNEVKRTLV
jgi:hypothetical protein